MPQLTSQRPVRWQGGFEGQGGAIYNRGEIIVEGDAVFYENYSGVSRLCDIVCRSPFLPRNIIFANHCIVAPTKLLVRY